MTNKINNPPTVTLKSTEDEEPSQTITLPWIPKVSPQLKKVFRKAGFKVVFKANSNLQSILSKKNKVKLPPNSYPGIYKIPCLCEVPPYIGKTKLRICTRIGQHEGYVRKEQWKNSGAAQHARTCPHGPNFGEVETVTVEHRKFERGVRESLEIQRHRSAPKFGGINLDDGQFLNNTFWMPFMDFITKEEKERRNRRQNPSVTSDENIEEDNA